MTEQNFDTPVTHRRPVLGLMGEFSAGKTTLLNVLVGREMLPTRVTATRVPPIWLSYGPEQAHYVDTDGEHHSISLAELESVPLDGVAFIKIMTEADVLRDIDLFDTPGISDPNISDEVRLAIVQHLDGVIWCTHATQAWRESERSAWMAMPQGLTDNSVLLVTRSDALAEKDLERVLRRMEREAGHMFSGVLPMSSLLAGEAMLAGDQAGLDASGMTALRSRMSELGAALAEGIAAENAPGPEALPNITPRRVQPGERRASQEGADDLADANDLTDDPVDDNKVRPDPDMASLLQSMARIGQPARAAAPAPIAAASIAAELEPAAAPLTLDRPVAAPASAPETEVDDVFARLNKRLQSEEPPAPEAALPEGTAEDAPEEDVFSGLVSGIMAGSTPEADPAPAPLDLGQFNRLDAAADAPEPEEVVEVGSVFDRLSALDPDPEETASDDPMLDRLNLTAEMRSAGGDLEEGGQDDLSEDDGIAEVEPESDAPPAPTSFLDRVSAISRAAAVEAGPTPEPAPVGEPIEDEDPAPVERVFSRRPAPEPIPDPIPEPKAEEEPLRERVFSRRPAPTPTPVKTDPVQPDAVQPDPLPVQFDKPPASPAPAPMQQTLAQPASASSAPGVMAAAPTLSLRRRKGMAGLWRQMIRQRRIETVTDMLLAMEDFLEELDDAQQVDLDAAGGHR